MLERDDFSELIAAGIIDAEKALEIEQFYAKKRRETPNRLLIVFSVLGALLVGLGILLIVAHNWDAMSRLSKTILSFIPVVIGQAACGYALFKKTDSQAWREGSAVFLFFAIGACISLVSQIYHIEVNTVIFVVSWMILCLPLVYLLRSTVTGIFYLIGITYFGTFLKEDATSFWSAHYYWILLLSILPHYYYLYKNKPESNSLQFMHLLVPLSFLIAWPIVIQAKEVFILTGYVSLLACLYLIGHSSFFKPKNSKVNTYMALGSLGTIGILLATSHQSFWDIDDIWKNGLLNQMGNPSYLLTWVFTIGACLLFYLNFRGKKIQEIKPVAWVFPIFLILVHLQFTTSIATIVINVLLLTIGILTTKEGAQKNHLGILNYGLLIITALITIRFFDSNLSFVWRGIIFLLVGAGFFLVNNWMIRKREFLS